MNVSDAARSIRCLALLFAAGAILSACSTDLTIDSSIHLSTGGQATMRFQPLPPTGTISLRNSGPDRAHLEFFGPSLDNPAGVDRILTVELGPGGTSLESISGVQRIEVTMLGLDQTTIIYTIRARDGVGYTVDAGGEAVLTAGETPNAKSEATDKAESNANR